jgi:S1-C subfamily serine protease
VRLARGQGVAANPIEAVTWLAKAAHAGVAEAACTLGAMYHDGNGVSQNATEAFKWFTIAAERGKPVAQRFLGAMYAKGSGCRQDNLDAYKWLFIAAGNGEPDSDLMKELRENMAPAQIHEAETKASMALFRKSEAGPEPTPAIRIPPAPVRPALPASSASAGSGFFITDDGYFLTCYHVVAGASRIRLKVGPREIPAQLVWSNADHDVALVKAQGWFAALPIVPSSCAGLGECIFTVGFPNTDVQGLSPKFSPGEISAMAGVQDDSRLFQVSLPICSPAIPADR